LPNWATLLQAIAVKWRQEADKRQIIADLQRVGGDLHMRPAAGCRRAPCRATGPQRVEPKAAVALPCGVARAGEVEDYGYFDQEKAGARAQLLIFREELRAATFHHCALGASAIDVQPDPPVVYADIHEMLLARAEAGPVFYKDMAYYVTPYLAEDAAFRDRPATPFLCEILAQRLHRITRSIRI